jgi:hypothetical protein
VPPLRLGLEARRAQPVERRLEVVDDDREVPARRHHRVVVVHQVDLGAGPLQPGEALAEGGRRLDLLEPEQLEELDGALDIRGRDLDSDVVDHRPRSYRDGTDTQRFVRWREIMESMRQSWTDARLDDFRQDVDKWFDAVDARFDETNRRMDAGFARVDTDDGRDRDPALTRSVPPTS